MKLQHEEILVSSHNNTKSGGVKYRFWSVIRSTSRTCELCELRAKILRQSGNLQEVEPTSKWIDEDCIIRCHVDGRVAKFGDGAVAVPWDGNTRWQIAVIHLS